MSKPIIQAAEYLVELAGLFHDFGKANQAIQDKLRNTLKKSRAVNEPLRHEYVSWWMLELLVGQPQHDADWLGILAQPQALQTTLDTALNTEYLDHDAQGNLARKFNKERKPDH